MPRLTSRQHAERALAQMLPLDVITPGLKEKWLAAIEAEMVAYADMLLDRYTALPQWVRDQAEKWLAEEGASGRNRTDTT